jgi:hypothetical protein
MNSPIVRRPLHALVDALPDRELIAARRFLEFLRDRSPARPEAVVETVPTELQGLFVDPVDEQAEGSRHSWKPISLGLD